MSPKSDKKAKKLSSFVEPPRPSAEDVAQAKAAGAEIHAFDPRRVRAFVTGQITLGDLEGIGKDDQYRMARMGYDLLTQGKLEDARKVFEGLHALDPFDAYFLSALGSIAQQESKLEEADARYSRALEINPFFAAALANRGEVRLARGKVNEAIDDFARAIKEDPEGHDPAVRRARAIVDTIKKQLESGRLPTPLPSAPPASPKPPPPAKTPLPARPPAPAAKAPPPAARTPLPAKRPTPRKK